MSRYERSKIPSSVPKMIVFAAVTAALIGLLGTLIGNVSFVPSRTYYAMFTDATGVFPGDRVRLSGVEVGAVKGVELERQGEHTRARIKFTVEKSVPLFAAADLALRFENIVGQRYLAIEEKPGSGAVMKPNGTFPLEQTSPALDLTVLFNGFQPLFRALDPERLNTFSYELIRALQGEGGTVQSLMRDTAQLTNTLADRDKVIGGVVDNLGAVLSTVGNRDQQLTALIVQFRNLMAGLADDREAVEASLPDLANLLDGTAGLLRGVRPHLKDDVTQLGILARQVYATRGVLDASLKRTPFKLRTLARTASYGSWFNFYACGLEINLTLLDGTIKLGGPAVGANEADTVCGAGGVQ